MNAASFASSGARSNERHSRITSAIEASTCSAMSESTACINGWSARCFWNTLRCLA